MLRTFSDYVSFPNNCTSAFSDKNRTNRTQDLCHSVRSDSRVDSAGKVPKLILLIRESYARKNMMVFCRVSHETLDSARMTTRRSDEKLAVAETEKIKT